MRFVSDESSWKRLFFSLKHMEFNPVISLCACEMRPLTSSSCTALLVNVLTALLFLLPQNQVAICNIQNTSAEDQHFKVSHFLFFKATYTLHHKSTFVPTDLTITLDISHSSEHRVRGLHLLELVTHNLLLLHQIEISFPRAEDYSDLFLPHPFTIRS